MTPHWRVALVTGASLGIGRAITLQLAAQGTDLIVVAREPDRLEAFAKECRHAHRVNVEVLAADLIDADGLARVEDRLLATPSVDLLVNNAGFATMGAFHDLPIEIEARMIALNVTAPMRLTHAALRSMLRERRGSIVNVSSMSGLQPFPAQAAYGATKAFVNSFSEAVHEEIRGSGVTITVTMPGFVRTPLTDQMPLDRVPSFLWTTPDTVAAATLRAARRGRPTVVPAGRHRAVAGPLAMVPRPAKRRVAGRLARREFQR
jgi:hypothetical protein